MFINDRECSGIHKFEYSHVPKYSNIQMNEHTKMFNVWWPPDKVSGVLKIKVFGNYKRFDQWQYVEFCVKYQN